MSVCSNITRLGVFILRDYAVENDVDSTSVIIAPDADHANASILPGVPTYVVSISHHVDVSLLEVVALVLLKQHY